jgi:molybdopterin converting factor small subunit
MAQVQLWGSLAAAAGGHQVVEIAAKDIGELFRKLAERYPATQAFIDQGVAVSIGGTIYRDSWSQPLPDGEEIFLLPRIAGG